MTCTVLYIEDNPGNIRLVERLLSRRPQTGLRVAMNGREGIAAAIDGQPDLILLDNHLPDATGGEILRELTAAEATAAIPVVILTGDANTATAAELRAIGAADFLGKPFDIHQFMTMLDRYLPR